MLRLKPNYKLYLVYLIIVILENNSTRYSHFSFIKTTGHDQCVHVLFDKIIL